MTPSGTDGGSAEQLQQQQQPSSAQPASAHGLAPAAAVAAAAAPAAVAAAAAAAAAAAPTPAPAPAAVGGAPPPSALPPPQVLSPSAVEPDAYGSPVASQPSVTAVATVTAVRKPQPQQLPLSTGAGSDGAKVAAAAGGVGKAAVIASEGKGSVRWGDEPSPGKGDGTESKKFKDVEEGEPQKKKHKKKRKCSTLICCFCCCFWLLGIITLAVVLPVCLIHGCPPSSDSNDSISPDEELYNLRLLARSEDSAKRVRDLIPPLLRGFVNVTLLDSSLIEVLDFGALDVLREVRNELLTKYADQLSFLIPDFPVRVAPDLNRVAFTALATGSGGVDVASIASALGISVSGTTSSASLSSIVAQALNSSSGSLDALVSLLPASVQQAVTDAAAQVAAAASAVTASDGAGGLSAFLSSLASSGGSLLAALQSGAADSAGTAAADAVQEHQSLVAAAEEGAAKDLTGFATGAASSGTGTGAVGDDTSAWYLKKALVPDAWKLTQGLPDVVVAVIDTGFDVNHPDLKDSLWVNPGEVPNDGIDNDGNGFIDDVHGFDFAGSGGACLGDWRAAQAPAPPPPSPPPPSPPPPASGRRRASRTPTSADGATVVKPTTASQLAKLCTPDADVSPEPGEDGHGSHVAGIVAAAANRLAGISGAAPRVKVMVLKVFDSKQRFYASHVVAAYAYAVRMGAHIVSCSFGPYVPNIRPTATELTSLRSQQELYSRAVAPMESKGMLLVAAAGNELTDLNQLAAVGSIYLPCTLPNANVICVTGSNPTDRLITGSNGNQAVGVNYGSNVVDISAPGQDVYNIVPVAQGSYGNKTGSSMATPLVSGVAALVASVVGSTGAAAAAPSFFQASRIKALLLETADALPGLPVRGNRRLNAQRAVQAAYAAVNGSFLLTPSSTFYTANGGTAALLAAGLSEAYYAVAVTGGGGNVSATGFANLTLPSAPFDVSVRVPSPSSPVTRLLTFRYNASTMPGATPGSGLLLRLSGLLRLPSAGLWGVQLSGTMAASAVRMAVGQRVVTFPSMGSKVTLMAQAAGLYDFELLVLNPGQPLELRWAAPGGGAFGSPTDDMFVVAAYARATHPRYAPNVTLAAATAGMHVSWEYSTVDADRPAPLPAAFLSTFSTGLPPSSSPYTPLRNAAYWPGSLFSQPGTFGTLVSNAAAAALAAPNPSPDIVTPDQTVTGAYGTVVGHIQPPASGGLQLQAVCSSCRVYLQGVLVIDAAQPLPLGSASGAQPAALTAVSGCLAIPSTAAASTAAKPGGITVYTLEIRFAMGDMSRGVLSMSWSPCVAGASTGQWSSISGLVISSVMWAPPARAVFTRSALRCDLWQSNGPADGGVVPSPRDRTPLASYSLPRPGSMNQDCSLWSNNPACTGVALLNVLDILPTASEGAYHVRCWAFWNGTFAKGTLALRGALLSAGAGSALPAAAYLGNTQVLRSISSTAPPLVNFNRQSLAPRVTWLGQYLQLLAFEYPDVSASLVMGVLDGVETFSMRDHLLIDTRMIVPGRT